MKNSLTALLITTLLYLQGCTLALKEPKTLTVQVDPNKTTTVTSTATVSCQHYFFAWQCKLKNELTEAK